MLVALFDLRFSGLRSGGYDVTRDGTFLFPHEEGESVATREQLDIHVVVDWEQELLERVPLP